jgi:hypothetical protein
MMTKEKIMNGIKNLPDPVTIDDIPDDVILIEKIERGIEQSDNNQVVSDEELDHLFEELSPEHKRTPDQSILKIEAVNE